MEGGREGGGEKSNAFFLVFWKSKCSNSIKITIDINCLSGKVQLHYPSPRPFHFPLSLPPRKKWIDSVYFYIVGTWRTKNVCTRWQLHFQKISVYCESLAWKVICGDSRAAAFDGISCMFCLYLYLKMYFLLYVLFMYMGYSGFFTTPILSFLIDPEWYESWNCATKIRKTWQILLFKLYIGWSISEIFGVIWNYFSFTCSIEKNV